MSKLGSTDRYALVGMVGEVERSGLTSEGVKHGQIDGEAAQTCVSMKTGHNGMDMSVVSKLQYQHRIVRCLIPHKPARMWFGDG